MKKVVMLSTGGTIASKKNPQTGLYTAGLLTGEELAKVCQLPADIKVEVQSVFQVPSNQMDEDKMFLLKQKIAAVLEDETVTGIVVTHGTDTLEETAYFLDLTVKDERPVVLAGSQRVPDVLGSDAFVNLRQAIIVASDEKSKNMGVLVFFNEQIFAAKHVKKVHTANVNGFNSDGVGYLGVFDQDKVHFYQRPIARETYALPETPPPVDLIKWYAGSDDKFIRCSIESGAKGIVLEGAGRGHVSPSMMEAVEDAIQANIKVVITSACQEGEVGIVYDFPGSVYDLVNKGAIIGRNLDSKKARLKLGILLAIGEESIKEKFS